MLAETHVTDDIVNAEIEIDGYDLIRCNSNSRHTGGVIMFVQSSLKWKVIVNKCISKTWMLMISIDDVYMYGRYGVIYKSPKEKINDFLELLTDFCDESCNLETRNIIIGDMNINVGKKSKNVKKYLSVIDQLNLMQHVNIPTRVCKKSSTIIDHILSNEEKISWNVNVESPTDHSLIEISFKGGGKKLMEKPKIVRKCWRNYSKEKLIEEIKNIEWNDDDITDEWEIFYSKLKNTVSMMVQKKEMAARHCNRWFTPQIRCMKKSVRDAREKFEWSQDVNDRDEINKLMRKYKEAIVDAKEKEVKNSLEKNKKNSRKLWKTLKAIYSNKSSKILTIEYDDGEEISCDYSNANRMNNEFISSVEKIIMNIPTPSNMHYNDLIPKCDSKFSISNIDINDLKRILIQLKNKTFNDDITGRVLNDAICEENFAEQIVKMINKSFNECIIPEELKTSLITPIPKIDFPKTPKDYRPINNLPVIEKVIECVVHEQLSEFLSSNNILCDEQYGFRKNHSTETAIQSVLYELIDSNEKKKKTVAIFLDLRRAFETVSREVLLEKLLIYGCDEKAIKWFQNFLSKRKQCVKINEVISDPTEVNYGLPQGSKLANLLFIIFINDLRFNLKHSKISMYADDCMIYVSDNDIDHAKAQLNDDLMRVDDWLKFNKLSLNTEKCNTMIFNDKKDESNMSIKIGNEIINRVDCIKYLGVYIDDELNFEGHYDKLLKKINKRVGLMRRINKKMNMESKKIFVKSIILPHIDYCSSILLMFSDEKIKKIQRAINRALRIALMLPNDSNVKEMLENFNLMTVNQRIHFNAIKLIYHATEKGSPVSFASKFKKRSEMRPRTLRSDNNFDIPMWKSKKSVTSIFVKSTKILNDIQATTKPHENFIMTTKKFIKEKIN